MSATTGNKNNDANEVFKLTEQEKQEGLLAIEQLPGNIHLYIVAYKKQSIKVDISLRDWSSKLKTESKDVGVPERAISAALARMHTIEAERLLEKARSNAVQNDEKVANEKATDSLISSASSSSSATTLAPDKETDAEKLMRYLTATGHKIFLDQHGHAFIITKDIATGIEEPLELLDKDFVEYATGTYYDWTDGKVIHSSDVNNVAIILSHRARRKNIDPSTGEIIVKPLYVRVAWEDSSKQDTILIDIADTKRHIIAIKAGQGFKVLNQREVPIMFRRHNRLPLPIPSMVDDKKVMEDFLDLYQIFDYYKRLMVKVTMAMPMIPDIPHPVELVLGGKGSIKSSYGSAVKNSIDPATTTTLTIPNTEDDFSLQGYHNYFLLYDNIKNKNVPKWFPDALCRFVYMEEVEKRQHYSNMKTVSFGASGCAMINGINKMFVDEDVMDRCVTRNFTRLKKGKFLPKRAVNAQYRKLLPELLAYRCSVVSEALKLYPIVEKEIASELTRMADFVCWGESLSRAYGYPKGEFIKAYNENLDLQNIEAIQNSTLGKVIVNFVHSEYNKIMSDRKNYGEAAKVVYNNAIGPRAVFVFQGTLDQLEKHLKRIAGAPPFSIEDFDKRKDWPKGSNKITQWIRLIQSNLSEGFGIDVDIRQDTTGKLTGIKNKIWVEITKNPDVADAKEMFGEDGDIFIKGGGDGTMRTRGKGKDKGNDGGKPDSGSGGEGSSDSGQKVLPKGPSPSSPSSPSSPNHAQKMEASTLSDPENSYNQPKNPGESLHSRAPNSSNIASFDKRGSNHGGEDGEDREDTFENNIVETGASDSSERQRLLQQQQIIQSAPSFQDIKSLQTFENLQKLHPACQSMVCIDWEYTQEAEDGGAGDDVYLFAYIDTQGNQGALHVDDFDTPRDFAIAVNKLIEKYDHSVAYWSRGKDSKKNNGNNNKTSDLVQWNNFCLKVGAPNIVEWTGDYDEYPTIRSTINEKHRHIDAHAIHNQSFIKSGIYKGAIGPMGLDEVHRAVFPNRKMGKIPGIDGSNINPEDFPIDIQRAYCLRDAQLVYEIMTNNNGQLLGVMQEVSSYIGKDIEYVCHARDMGYLVEPVLNAMGYQAGSSHHWWDGPYEGGLVQQPIRGRHKHAIGVDCVGMYPEIMMRYNISSETLCCPCCQNNPKAREKAVTGDPELDAKGYWLCEEKEGLFPKFMRGLKEKRQEFKRLRDNAEKGSDVYRQYDVAQLAIKIYMNASYGCFGFAGFNYKDKRVAEMITGIGRKFATGAKEMAESEKHNFHCIYGDTDGLLLVEKEDSFNEENNPFTMGTAKARVKPLLDECYQRFNLPIENDRNFIEVTPVERKQYFGIDAESKKVIVKGLEGIKRDACRFNQQQFKRLMDNYEKGLDPIPDVVTGLETINNDNLTAEDMVISATQNEETEDYSPTSAMGKLVRECGTKKGDSVKYYLTGKKGNAYSPYFEDCNIARYKKEHLTDIGKVLYAMGYDVDELYGPKFGASKELIKRREKNDKKKGKKKQNKKKKQAHGRQETFDEEES